MDLERWQKLESIFHEAIERAPNQIAPFLNTVCAGDERLRIEAEKLIAAHMQGSDFIKQPAFEQAVQLLGGRAEDENPAGRQFGPYRVVRELGRGGMGAVYLAERADDQYRKTVAVKLIRRSTVSDPVLRRFRHERQILANLEHPNIARLIDGGTSEDGLPFFVMEFVEGKPITSFCNERALPNKERLELFRGVCTAVEYAHRQKVIHRDLKPSNILVSDEGVPKLLDFGIAKIIDSGEGVETMHTATGIRLLTPDYASPEQLRGEPLTKLTDVYSLGIILEELIEGPRAKTGQWRHTSDTIESTETTPRIDASLRAILRTARHERPEHRYQSVEELSDDVGRYLTGVPVVAASNEITSTPNVSAFRKIAAAAAVVITLLLGGVMAVTYQVYRTSTERVDKPGAEGRDADQPIAEIRRISQPAPVDHHKAIKAIGRLDTLAAEYGSDDTVSLEIAAAYERIGDVQNDLTSRNGDNLKLAIDSYRKSLKIRETKVEDNARDLDLRRDTAYTYLKTARLEHETREFTGALENGRLALAHLVAMVKDKPADVDFRDRMMQAYYEVGQILQDSGSAEGAEAHYRQYARLFETLPPPENASN